MFKLLECNRCPNVLSVECTSIEEFSNKVVHAKWDFDPEADWSTDMLCPECQLRTIKRRVAYAFRGWFS